MGRLSWRLADVAEVRPETGRVVTLALEVPDWDGHLPGQHVDVRLTAEDGYEAERAYSIASAPNALVAYELNGKPFPRRHGAPVRGLVPDLYFWKSAKWLTGIRFAVNDAPGYWEVRGYHNHGDPWRQERYS